MAKKMRDVLACVVFLALSVSTQPSAAQQTPVPHPRDMLGFTPGDDYQIADFTQMQEYFQALALASPRVRLSSAGKTPEGNDILVVAISSVENLERLDRYKDIARTLARARVSEDEARALAVEGRAITWIDNGLHAAEMAHAQHSFLLAHKVATEESDEMREIRDNVILVLLPCVNPDGLDLVADWYRRTVHTPYQDSPMPWLFNKYMGYENNREFFMQSQPETQIISRLLYFEWVPQVMYNQHQGFYPTRIFVPPFPDPFNPNIDAGVIRGIDLVGASMQHRFEREGKDGVLTRYGFSSWYNGSLRTTTYFHNVIGILTETTHDSPSPFYYDPADFPDTFGNGWSTRVASTNYSRPFRGDTLHFSDAVDYMLTGSMGVLEASAKYREEFLYGIYQMGARQIDGPVTGKFVEILMRGGVEVHRADAPFVADGQSFAAGSYVVDLAQPYRPFAKDLLEAQRYPDIRQYPGGPPVPPYDNAGWTLSYQMGVRTVPIDRVFDASLTRLDGYPTAAPTPTAGVEDDARYGYALDPRSNNTVIAINRLLSAGRRVFRSAEPLTVGGETYPPGAFVIPREPEETPVMAVLLRDLGIEARPLNDAPANELYVIRHGRVGVYKSWVVEWVDGWTASEGWTRSLLDEYEFPYQSIVNADVRAGGEGGGLRDRFDVIVIPNQDVGDIVGGYRPGRRHFGLVHQNLPPPEYQGGIETDGVAALREFVELGGTLVLVDRATDLATEHLGLPVRNVVKDLPDNQFFGPGSIVRIQADVTHPVAWGMARDGAAYFRKSRVFESDDPSVTTVVRYAADDILMSGWLLGEEHLAGKDAVVDVQLGRGRVIMFGFSPYFRSWPHATFKLFLNALYR